VRTTAVIILVAGAVALSTGLAHAAAGSTDIQSRYTNAYRQCPGFKTAVVPEMLDCISAEFEIQDKRLNAAYAKAMAGLNAPRKASLRSAQRAWIAYRDAWCSVTYDADSGQQEHVDSNQCMLDETIAQTMKLEDLARHSE
jgi:uncharacterized protein YecT (DUF1311 family)